MLGTLPKLVDKNFVIGFILPILIGALAIIGLLNDIAPFSTVYSSLNTDLFAKLTVFAVTLWGLAIVLMLVNYTFYRLLEGYIGPFNRASWRKRMRANFKKQSDSLEATYRIVTNNQAIVSNDLKRDYYAAVRRFNERWPSRRRLVLPTRFGNVICSAETYALEVYGVDSIAVWPRMQALFSKDFQALVDDARAQIDFFINLWVFSVLFAAIAIARIVYALYSTWPALEKVSEHAAVWGFGVGAIGAVLLAWGSYEGATERAGAWGELVRSAFDLYLSALANQLGYELPPAEADRRIFWGAINSAFLYQRPLPEKWRAVADKPMEDKGSGKSEHEEEGGKSQKAETTEPDQEKGNGEIDDLAATPNDADSDLTEEQKVTAS